MKSRGELLFVKKFLKWLSYDKRTLGLICLLFIVIVIDTSYARLYDLTSKLSNLEMKIVVFIAISAISLAGQYLFLVRVNRKIKNTYLKKILLPIPLSIIPKILLVALSVIFIIISWQLIVESKYNTILVVLVITLTYGTSSVLLGLLAYRFFLWIKSNRDIAIIAYGFASVLLSANAIITAIYLNTILITIMPDIAYPYAGGSLLYIPQEVYFRILEHAFFYSYIFSFISTWIATVTLLRNYSKTIGKLKYWLITSLPLIYFLSQFFLFEIQIYDYISLDPVLLSTILSLVFVFSKSVAGLMYGIAFWIVVKNIPKQSIIRSYMTISAIGFVFLFSSNQAINLAILPYPPLGLATISFMGFSSFLIFIGIYYSAISISQDIELRNSVRKFALKDSRLLDGIGYAEMERDIQNMVSMLATKMEEDTGIQTNLDESNIRIYLDEVVKIREEVGK